MRSPLRRRPPTLAALRPAVLLLAAGLTLSACSNDDSDATGIASLEDTGAAPTASATADGDTERQLLEFVQCLRDQGLDVPDPQVDAEGNLELGGPPGAGGPGGGADVQELQAAAQDCGGVPDGVLGGGQLDQSEIQDAALAFAQCLRDEGLDVSDPDFSGAGPGAGGGPFGDLDTDDPQVQAALETCQSELPAPGADQGT